MGAVDVVEDLAVVVGEHVAVQFELAAGLGDGRHHLALLRGEVEHPEKAGGLEFAEEPEGAEGDHLRGGAVTGELAHFGGEFGDQEGVLVVGLDHVGDEVADLEDARGAVEELAEDVPFGGALGAEFDGEFGFEVAKLGFEFRREGEDAQAEAVGAVVLCAFRFALFGAGTGGVLGVGLIGQDLGRGCHG